MKLHEHPLQELSPQRQEPRVKKQARKSETNRQLGQKSTSQTPTQVRKFSIRLPQPPPEEDEAEEVPPENPACSTTGVLSPIGAARTNDEPTDVNIPGDESRQGIVA